MAAHSANTLSIESKDAEAWRKIDGFPSFSVSSHGRVRRDERGRKNGIPGTILKNSRDKNGYAVVGLWLNGKVSKQYVHRLVAIAFLGPAPKGRHVAHWDGDGMNPRLENIRWATQSENEADKRRHGRANYTPRGSRMFSAQQVLDIRKSLRGGESARSVARQFGCSHGTILTAARHGAA